MEQSLQPFGFEYEYQGKRFAFDVLAASKEEAESRVASMGKADSVGALHQQVNTTSDSCV